MADVDRGDFEERPKLSSWRLRSPIVQNTIASICLAMTPGIYLAITQLGAGGSSAAATVVNSKVNVILYCIFFVVSICAGPCINLLGPKICLAFGTTGYAVYVGGLWYLSDKQQTGFPLFSGAYLGFTAGFLWTACAYASQAYGDERRKAWFVQLQLALQSVGSMVGSAIALGANFNKKAAGGVGAGVYGAFIGIHLAAGLIALLFIVDPKTVTRNDGTHLAVFPRPSIKSELAGIREAFMNPRVIIFILAGFTFDLWIPCIGSWNSYTFGLRTRSLNAFCFYLMQMTGGFIILFFAANPWIKSRKMRNVAVVVWVLIINVAGYGAWIGYLAVTKPDRAVAGPAIDWTSSDFGGPFVIYMVIGLMATSMRNLVYYMNAVATNDPVKQARYAGIMHAMPEGGLALAFGIETTKPKFINEGIAFLVLTVVACGVCFYGVWNYSTETLWGQEDGVIVPVSDAHRLGIETGEKVHTDADKDAPAEVRVIPAN